MIMESEEKKLFRTRAHNLAQILKNDFRNDANQLCERLEIKKETLNKFLNPDSDRPCKDRAARRIESILGKSPHTLDYEFSENQEIYYVTVGTNAHFTYEVVKILMDEEAVKECSAVLGNFDILLKVEVESYLFLDLLLAKIAKLPGVKRSQTYTSIKELRWQREQPKNMNLPDKNSQIYSNNGIERYIEQKIHYHLDKIKELEKGEVSIQDTDSVPLQTQKILDGAVISIRAIRTPDEDLKGFDDYITLEKQLILEGIKSRRIIMLPDQIYKTEWSKYRKDFERFKDIGSEVRFLLSSQWTPTPLSEQVEQFVIVDNKFVCVRREEQNRLLIKRSREMVDLYAKSFDANWYRSQKLDEVERTLDSSPYQGFL